MDVNVEFYAASLELFRSLLENLMCTEYEVM